MATPQNLQQPVAGAIDPAKGTVQGQMTGLLSKDSEYMQQAKADSLQAMNSRGLANSSMAVGAGQGAAIRAALPIADADARAYNNQSLTNQQADNAFRTAGNQFQYGSALSEQDQAQRLALADQGFGFNTALSEQQKLNQQAIQASGADLQSGLDAQKYLAEKDRDTLAAQLDLTQGEIQHQQDIEKAFLQATSGVRTTASSDAALIGRTEGLTATQQNAAMQKVYDQANLDIAFIQSVFSQPQSWNW